MMDYQKTESYKKGVEIFKKKYSPNRFSSIEELYEFSPALADTIFSNGIYDIWEVKTPNLSIYEKEIVALTSLITMANSPSEIKAHTYNCLNVGMTKQQIVELLTLLTIYIGVPNVIFSLNIVKEGFKEFDQIHGD